MSSAGTICRSVRHSFSAAITIKPESAFRIALRDDPSSAEAQYGLGSVYLKQDKNAEARASFEQALKLTASYPDTGPNAWNNLGLLATREGRTSDAIGYFQEALRMSPDYWIALENLGNAYPPAETLGRSTRHIGTGRGSQTKGPGSKLQPGHGLCADGRHRTRLPISAKCFEIAPRLSGGIKQSRDPISCEPGAAMKQWPSLRNASVPRPVSIRLTSTWHAFTAWRAIAIRRAPCCSNC